MIRLLSLLGLGVFLTGCVSVEEEATVNKAGEMRVVSKMDFSALMGMGQAVSKEQDRQREKYILDLEDRVFLEDEIEAMKLVMEHFQSELDLLESEADGYEDDFVVDSEILLEALYASEEQYRLLRMLKFNPHITDRRKDEIREELALLEYPEEDDIVSCDELSEQTRNNLEMVNRFDILGISCEKSEEGMVSITTDLTYLPAYFDYNNGIYTLRDYFNMATADTDVFGDFEDEDVSPDFMVDMLRSSNFDYQITLVFPEDIVETNFGMIVDGNQRAITFDILELLGAVDEGDDLVVKTAVYTEPVTRSSRSMERPGSNVYSGDVKNYRSPYASRNWRKNYYQRGVSENVEQIEPLELVPSDASLSPVRRYHQIQMQRLRNR